MNSKKFALAFAATGISIEILTLLPDTDLVIEMRFILEQQFDILSSLICDKEYPPFKMKVFDSYITQMRRNIDDINNTQGYNT